jgi:dTDP-4-amino-4,6-dideoxygalactose transaminase
MPAILGDAPAFDHKINIVKPVLPLYNEMEDDVRNILSSGMVTKGRYLRMFEDNVSEYLHVKHSIGVSSCTTGLMLAYQALGLTGEVIVPSFTFMATVSSLVWCGLEPVFVDVETGTTNIDPSEIKEAITPKTSAIVGVHNFGNPARISQLEAIASDHNLKLIFDAAHGFGALYQGKPVGLQGHVQVFSLSPTKLLITGEGGIVATGDDEIARRIRSGREYGNDGMYDSEFAGLNARLAEFNAVMGIKSLGKLERAAHSRNLTAALYVQALNQLPGIGFQEILPGNRSSYKDFSITIDQDQFGLRRDELATVLEAENVDTRKYYDPPIHQQMAYRKYYNGKSLNNTAHLAKNSLSLPMWSNMDASVVMRICRAIQDAHNFSSDIRQKLQSGESK